MITFLCHAPDQATFRGVMNALLHPIDGKPLMRHDEETGAWVSHSDIVVGEIERFVKTPAVFDENDEVVTPEVVIPGHHVNLCAIGPLEHYLTGEITVDGVTYPAIEQMDENGNLKRAVDRTRILALLGAMNEVDAADGVPGGLAGTSGMAILDETEIMSPALLISPVGTNLT